MTQSVAKKFNQKSQLIKPIQKNKKLISYPNIVARDGKKGKMTIRKIVKRSAATKPNRRDGTFLRVLIKNAN